MKEKAKEDELVDYLIGAAESYRRDVLSIGAKLKRFMRFIKAKINRETFNDVLLMDIDKYLSEDISEDRINLNIIIADILDLVENDISTIDRVLMNFQVMHSSPVFSNENSIILERNYCIVLLKIAKNRILARGS